MRYINTPKTSLKGINAELVKVQDAFEDVLDRKGDGANFLDTDLDMNSQRILNLPEPVYSQEPVRLGDVKPFIDETKTARDAAVGAAGVAQESAEASATSASSAEQSAASAANSAAKAKDTVQSFVDSFALKIFQSPTGSGLTEIQTRTVDAGEVYEVRKTSDNSLATIYSDAAGKAEIVQNGTSNVSGSDGVVEFYTSAESQYILYNSEKYFSFNLLQKYNTFDSVQEMINYPHLSEGFISLVKGTQYLCGSNSPNSILDFTPMNAIRAVGFTSFNGEDATEALQSMASISDNADIIFPNEGSIILRGTVNLVKPKSVDFGNIEVNYDRVDTLNPIVVGETVVIEKGVLSDQLDAYTNEITVTDNTNILPDSMLSIYNPVDYSWSGARPVYRQGEFQFVSSVDGNTVKIKANTIDTYPIGTKIYLVETRKTDITGTVLFRNVGSYAACFGLRVHSVVDSDFTGLSVKLVNGTHALSLNRCVNCYGTSMNVVQESTQVSGLNYGLSQASCCHNTFEGSFHAERHGSTTGNDGSFGGSINRHLTIRGRVTTTGIGGVQAADFHGDCEHCKYGGYIEGTSLGGHDTIIEEGSVVVSPKSGLSPVSYAECKSTKHAARYITIICKGNTVNRGAIDAGGNSNVIADFTTWGGDFDFTGSTIIAKELTYGAIIIRNRGALDISYSIIVKGMVKDAPLSPASIVCSPVTGTAPKLVVFDNDFWLPTISTGALDNATGIVQKGKVSVFIASGSIRANAVVTFPHEFPSGRLPYISVSSSKGLIGTSLLVASATGNDEPKFVANLHTIDGVPTTTDATIDIYWKAEV